MGSYVAAIDQGTTSSRCALIDQHGAIVAMAQREHRQIYPKPGWVEHDPIEIRLNVTGVIGEALGQLGASPSDVAAVGVTNQRETTLLWSKETGEPLGNAVVWQDVRTAELCRELGGDDGVDRFRDRTGLPLATYFAGPKIRWLLDHDPELRERAAGDDLAFGTMDTWVAWNLTGEHVTDVTNASRTLLMDLETLSWDDDLLDAVGVPRSVLPRIVPSSGVIAPSNDPLDGVPFAGILGDQQAALFGQACFDPGSAKNTYGTGCFLLLNTGEKAVRSENGLITTVAYQRMGEPARYALEGSIAIAGAGVQWLRDNLRMIDSAEEITDLALEVDDNGGVYFVPAFSGLFAPWWRDDARGVITGLTRYANRGHLARAVLESTAFQSRDVLEAMEVDSGVALSRLKVDGGMVVNDILMQFQADMLDVDVVRPRISETTVLGAAYAAGLAVGYWESLDEIASHWEEDRTFKPSMDPEDRDRRYREWGKAVDRSMGWVE
ncbi:MAG: glycerol kinase GlpK [Actinomycetota bacterium]|nr:glycerol kinase GlpK [Actinomycetota bacterium]